MSKYIILTKALLKNGNGLLNDDKKKKIKAIAIAAAIIAACIPTIIAFIYFIESAYDMLYKINQQGLIFTVGINFTFYFYILFCHILFFKCNVLFKGYRKFIATAIKTMAYNSFKIHYNAAI
ncbi:hypothetical protein CcarbDRAFT_2796 [Clostridium carboxidivorans P7]|uniref:Uncharacterized protein n=1 Tax=Clostridium carboxidivorans P7 TaxID=536227 RepID=C6PVH9_9CLOT|nr:hypothetical protein [Clostridium carboxidivorans]EET86744.1 hypothetical protein CcarbDRAFT_2796 [Clostridium carboxidivorans P7]